MGAPKGASRQASLVLPGARDSALSARRETMTQKSRLFKGTQKKPAAANRHGKIVKNKKGKGAPPGQRLLSREHSF